jgi:hypothetical protein
MGINPESLMDTNCIYNMHMKQLQMQEYHTGRFKPRQNNNPIATRGKTSDENVRIAEQFLPVTISFSNKAEKACLQPCPT